MNRVRQIGIGLAFSLSLVSSTAFARVERLDDSASPRGIVTSPPMLSEFGQPVGAAVRGPAPSYGIVKFGRIDYRLATAKYIGKAARIYFVIPVAIPGLRSPMGLRVDWLGNGTFASGSARPGERTLVWTGTVREAFINEGLNMTMQVELRQLLRASSGLAFESYFEIEVSP
jgi:hypothetical protein